MERMAKTKERRAWLYLSRADDDTLLKLEGQFAGKLTEAAILSVVVSAALKACAESGYKFPLNLRHIEPVARVEFNEPKSRMK